MTRKKFTVLIFCLLTAVSLWLPRQTKAINAWGDWFDRTVGQRGFNDIGFGRNDPRTIAANAINIGLGLLGVLAIILIMYAGFVWMTASGNPEKVDIAKKILVSASIGLLIILSAWAIAIYILSRLWLATGAGGGAIQGLPCTPDGITTSCGCGGERTCAGGQWGACLGSDCGTGQRKACDANTLTPECDADNTACEPDGFCNPQDCLCSQRGGYGDPCDSDTTNNTCEANNSLCQQYLICDATQCTCLGEPVIEAISPTGGFCDGSVDTACVSDADCAAFTPKTCNLTAPNGAPGNLLTISGRYFLAYQAGVSKVLFWDGSGFTIEAPLAATVNPACSESWSDNQIVVVVPPGVSAGAIQVVAANGLDSTDNNRGPAINNFRPNNLKRPGLCNLNPVFGRLDTVLTYNGLGLAGVEAYFGSAYQNIKANNSQFMAAASGTAGVPNLRAGRTTTFVAAAKGPISNFLNFTQEAETTQAPVIVGFEPTTGPPGQYVTIRGSGFGRTRQDSQVYFGAATADYDFPKVCADSIWRDNEIIVKVPRGLSNGDYQLAVAVGNVRAQAPATFKVDQQATLLPGLCKIDPLFGQINDAINLWGEHFGAKNNDSQIGFYQNIFRKVGPKICVGGNKDGQACNADSDCDSNQCQGEILYWGFDPVSKDKARPDLATTKVPVGTMTGPVKVGKGQPTVFSNGINFTVGQCTQDGQCGGSNVCCAAGTPSAGRCKNSTAECYGSTDSCVYEWEFNTGSKNSCPPDKPNACQDGSCCRSQCVLDSASGRTTCMDNASCAGYNGQQCFDTLLCPNSPGNCSFNKDIVTTGTACSCSLLGYAGFQYNDQLNLCVGAQTCSLKEKVNLNGKAWERFCTKYNGVARWHINTKQTCPTGFTPTVTGGKVCVDLASTCDLCAANLTCANVGGSGKCVVPWPICPNNFTCQDQICTRKEGSCECCCDKTQNLPNKTNPACCAPLTCENNCGAGGNFGYCSGCANVGTTQEEHDAACNCTGSSGKFCDTTLPGGACRDCSQIGDPAACGTHAACCVDAKQGNACNGLIDTKLLGANNIAYCAYFGCGDNCQTASTTAAFASRDVCQEKCATSCDGRPDQPECQPDASKCPPGKPVCNDQCQCEPSSLGPEEPCKTKEGACSLLCGDPYKCRGDQGGEGPGQPDSATCLCCCNPFKKGSDPTKPDYDLCKAIGSGNLFCQENVGQCTGNARGLCCGCKADADCGDSATIGCGADSCCHNRSAIESVWPEQSSTEICRNTLIRAKFNTKMQVSSFSGNIIVVGDYGDGLCPDGTTLLAGLDDDANRDSFLVKLWRELKDLLSRVLPWTADKAASAAGNHNFCAVTGRTAGGAFFTGQTEKTYADFILTQPLTPATTYYVIIKGYAGPGSASGVLDINKIAFKGTNQTAIDNFNGITYPNAYIWSFTTGSDLCFLDRVVVNPSQYLFQKPRDNHAFYADALAANGQPIVSLPLYGWEWNWRSDNSAVASVSGQDYQATVTSGSKRDDQTFVYARATITADLISPLPTIGKYKEGRARIIVFICENPWPAVTDPTAWPIRWADKADNCTICTDPVTQKVRPCQPGDCLDNHFEFYYCRDQGGVGTANDLPSLALEPQVPIRGRYKYQSSSLWVDVLKDFYFFRIALPEVPTGLQVALTDAPRGGEVKVAWDTVRDMSYKVYYGTVSGNYNGYVEAGTASTTTISGLRNGQEYYFTVTATNLQKAESAYAGEVPFKVEDKIAPATPAGVNAKVVKTATDRQIVASWQADSSEPVSYIIEYGPNDSPAVSLKVGSVTSYTIKKLSNLDVQDYYWRVIAQDAGKNLSAPAARFCAKGCSGECPCEPR